MLTLLDLSNNNPRPLDWSAMRHHGIWGVWLKVSEGMSFTDVTFQDRAPQARIAGLRVGGYHFARPAPGTARREADYFVARLGKIGRRDLRPVLDLETTGELGSTQLHEWARSFQAHVHEQTGVRALLYSGPSFITERHWHTTLGTGAGLWLADYGPNDGRDHGASAPKPWRRIVAHQYTSVGSVPGVPGQVDLTHARKRRPLLAYGLRGIV